MHHDSVVGAIIVGLIPDGFVETLGGKYLLFVFDEQKKHGVFRAGKGKRVTAGEDLLFFFIDF